MDLLMISIAVVIAGVAALVGMSARRKHLVQKQKTIDAVKARARERERARFDKEEAEWRAKAVKYVVVEPESEKDIWKLSKQDKLPSGVTPFAKANVPLANSIFDESNTIIYMDEKLTVPLWGKNE